MIALVIDLNDAETHFDFDEFNDLYAKNKPTLFIKMTDIFAIHDVISSNMAFVCIAPEDAILREVINNLGNAKRNENEMSAGTTEVTLSLSAKVHKLQGLPVSFLGMVKRRPLNNPQTLMPTPKLSSWRRSAVFCTSSGFRQVPTSWTSWLSQSVRKTTNAGRI